MAYCNTTTDLQRVCANIENYQSQEIIENWTITSGQSSTYEKAGTGHVSQVFEDGTQLTVKTSIAEVEAAASTWYYDSDIVKLYIHTSDSTAPSNFEITAGEDWDALKDAKLNEAMEFIDGYLSAKYITPLQVRTRKTHTSNDYDYIIVRLCALVTCWLIISRVDPNDDIGREMFKEAYNPNPDIGEKKGIINQLLDGDFVLTDQISAREVGSYNLYSCSNNTVTTQPFLFGTYTGSQYEVWKIEIDTDGAPGTGTYKVSYDNGTEWDLTKQDMKSDNQLRMSIASGIYIYFPDVTYTSGDCWTVELFPVTDSAQNLSVYSVQVGR